MHDQRHVSRPVGHQALDVQISPHGLCLVSRQRDVICIRTASSDHIPHRHGPKRPDGDFPVRRVQPGQGHRTGIVDRDIARAAQGRVNELDQRVGGDPVPDHGCQSASTEQALGLSDPTGDGIESDFAGGIQSRLGQGDVSIQSARGEHDITHRREIAPDISVNTPGTEGTLAGFDLQPRVGDDRRTQIDVHLAAHRHLRGREDFTSERNLAARGEVDVLGRRIATRAAAASQEGGSSNDDLVLRDDAQGLRGQHFRCGGDGIGIRRTGRSAADHGHVAQSVQGQVPHLGPHDRAQGNVSGGLNGDALVRQDRRLLKRSKWPRYSRIENALGGENRLLFRVRHGEILDNRLGVDDLGFRVERLVARPLVINVMTLTHPLITQLQTIIVNVVGLGRPIVAVISLGFRDGLRVPSLLTDDVRRDPIIPPVPNPTSATGKRPCPSEVGMLEYGELHIRWH